MQDKISKKNTYFVLLRKGVFGSISYMRNQQCNIKENLENQVVILTQENFLYKTENLSLQNENVQLKEQLNWFQRQIFGKKSEYIHKKR
jgi:hypothetical protein